MTAFQRRLQYALMACALLALAVYATTGRPSAGKPVTAQPSISPSPLDFSGPIPHIAIVYDVGGRGTDGFNQLTWEGATRAAAVFDAVVTEVTAGPNETDADREARLIELAEADNVPIFILDPAYAAAVAKVAPKYPNTWFGMLDDGSVDAKNVIGIQFNVEQSSYLAGAAAALTSKTGKVGFIGAERIPGLQKYEAGFAAGARAVNPDIKARVAYLSKPAESRKVALGMYRAGVDVIFGTVGSSDNGVIQAAHERGLWAIGVDEDQYLLSDPSLRGAILTSMLKRADVVTYTVTMEVANGVPKDGNNVFGIDRDGVGYSTSGGFLDPIKAQLDAFAATIASGEILVPTKP